MRLGVSTSVIRSDLRFLGYFLKKFRSFDLFELGFLDPTFLNSINNIKKPYGIHAPFIFKLSSHPKFTSGDFEETFRKILKSALFARNLSAEYLIVHYPDTLQTKDWRSNFRLLEQLSNIIKVRVENTFGNSFFYKASDYRFLCKELNLGLCIDLGHLLIDDRLNPFEFIEQLADFIEEFHVYYANSKTYKTCHHMPWYEDKVYIDLLRLIKSFNVDIVIESTPECNGIEKLIDFLGVR
ncbi:xylose isomerase [Thermosipho melanesiensis]|uniref:Xylose isomerase domain protein TIM barrel n=2 Tax=Thermosipho melanesiensis TaxID=46541 RepID=A6LND6_THEM4|nr:TIM barrel protein [Thermosipho melanesiensis]ABR31437.1 Xylose isomerase domain protein TIM barrel [Thermosipho melanesiensis BI429]APT74496.1 xylose isomerase [Thermosipho melanesiensis]OOC36805.1 xylose isomerase [Thermosipho melanesiensis]OOC37342.1 xylose isomerase [Thermosipho melanesiensis]OOC38094.1 xylose isomerase [Thermosipho melanesiensis]